MSDLKPREIVKELDKYIIGQENAKRSVAIALRNRWRRRQVDKDLRDEIAPKNIILIGPTGVGKTGIARRLARLTRSPFYKVEASKFTEVGYVGRDVESMIRDLLELAVNMVKNDAKRIVEEKARQIAEERMLDLLLPKPQPIQMPNPEDPKETPLELITDSANEPSSTREKLRQMLRQGKLDSRFVDLELPDRSMPIVEIFSNVGMEEMGVNFKDMLGNLMPKNTKRRKVKVPEAMDILAQEEIQGRVDMDKVVKEAVEKVEQSVIHIRRFKEDLFQQALHQRVQPSGADVFRLIIDLLGHPGNVFNSLVLENKINAFCLQKCHVLKKQCIFRL